MADSKANVSSELNKLKVAELKQLLEKRGLPVSGKKVELIDRLVADGYAQDDQDITLDDSSAVERDIDELLKDEEIETIETEKENESEITFKESSPPKTKAGSKIVFDSSPTSETKETSNAEDKMAERLKRFGAVSEKSKKELRAQRFGMSGNGESGGATGDDLEKLKKRAERFGTVTSKSLEKEDQTSKLKLRAERFGQTVAPALSKTEGDEKLKQRAERFGVATAPTLSKSVEEEKLLKRKMKFGAVTSSSTDADAAKKRRAERFGLTA